MEMGIDKMDFCNRVCHTKLTKRITEAVMSPSRCARPSFQALAAGVHINGWVHTDIGIHLVQYTGTEYVTRN